MEALVFMLALLVPDPTNLGVPDWREREAWSVQYDNPLTALALPARHENPEVQSRCQQIRAKYLKWLDPIYVEKHIHATDYERWLYAYVVHGDSQLMTMEEIFHELHASMGRAALFIKLAPNRIPYTGEDIWWYVYEGGVPRWLAYGILDGEYETFLMHRWSYRFPSDTPHAREK